MGKSVLAKFVAGHIVSDFDYDFLHYESPPGILFAIMYFFIVMMLTIFSVCRNFCRSILIKLFSFSTIVKYASLCRHFMFCFLTRKQFITLLFYRQKENVMER